MVTVYRAPTPPALPQVFDRTLVRMRRDRAAARFDAHGFLHDRVAFDFSERLSAINRQFEAVLDLGCRTGRFAFTDPSAQTIRCDLSPAMAARAGGAVVVADEEELPFAEEHFDLVVSALSLHAVNDLPGALIQINRSLRPDGLFLGAVFAGETLTELRQVLGDADQAITGAALPRVAPFADVRDLGSLLQRARFALPVTDSERITVCYRDPFALFEDLRGMGETNALCDWRALTRGRPLRRDVLLRACTDYAERFSEPDGRIRATFEIVTMTGWAPHESQQKPLRPGSARARLADALGTRERSAGEKAGG
ncbi:MAG: methyltransferase domain-containing protein [Alphaproteobacteria bacterium]